MSPVECERACSALTALVRAEFGRKLSLVEITETYAGGRFDVRPCVVASEERVRWYMSRWYIFSHADENCGMTIDLGEKPSLEGLDDAYPQQPPVGALVVVETTAAGQLHVWPHPASPTEENARTTSTAATIRNRIGCEPTPDPHQFVSLVQPALFWCRPGFRCKARLQLYGDLGLHSDERPFCLHLGQVARGHVAI
jgi:hypothetical protein